MPGGGLSFGGTGTQGDPWLITSPKDLIALAEFLNSGDAASFDTGSAGIGNCHGYYFKQTADIDLTGVAWEPIGYSGSTYFAGHYDGDGHTIANAESTGMVDPDGFATAGIFGWVAFGSVEKLHVKNANFVATGEKKYSYVGGITGVCFGASIENCLVTNSSLESRRNNNNNNCAGSIAGSSAGGTFINCAAEKNTIKSMAYGGGFVGEVDDDVVSKDSTFKNCYAADCTVTATTDEPQGSSFAGGFAGQITTDNPTAENCFVYRVTLSIDGTSAAHTSFGVFAGNLWGNPPAYQSKIITKNCYYGECGTTNNVGDADPKTAEEFENGTVAKLLGDAFVQHGGSPSLSSKPADYSAVDAAIAKADKLNRDEYKDFSAVEAAINAVVRGKTLREQAAVDAMAKAIEDAIAALEKKSVETTVQLPQTGDDSNLALWAALLLVSGAAIGTMMAGKKRNYGK